MKRRSSKPEVMAISEHELTVMTNDLDRMHNDVSMPAMHEAVQEWTEKIRSGRSSRRGFLVGAGAVAGGLALATVPMGGIAGAATTKGATGKTVANTTSPTYPGTLTGDLLVAALAASLENLAVAAYGDTLSAASAGKLGTVPPAVATFVTTAKAQHTQHAAAWNSAITAAGHPKVTEPDPALTPTIDAAFAKVTDVTGAATLALMLENVAAQTYQAAVSAVKATSSVKVAASIQPVEMQHAAILYFATGQYPVPNAFNPTSDARSTTDLTG